MSPEGSVTRCIDLLRAGDPAAARQLWDQYFRRLVGLARKKLQGAPRRAADEEDVALSAFDSFCRGAERGRFEQLADRESLWRLLVVITARKAAHLVRDEGRQKRGGGAACADAGLESLLSREPSPDFAVEVAEEWERLMGLLGDADLRAVALARLEGYSVEEIAARLRLASSSIKRKLRLIRGVWNKECAP